MGLFGALFAGVSGLDSQSNEIGIISNNISNVNTVGFKENQAAFDTLVVPSATTGAFSPGGAIGQTQQLINLQGTIAATQSSTDVAISGGGLMFVTSAPVTAGGSVNPVYTRVGSFTQDSEGNFVNDNGYYLLGLPIDPATGQPVANNVQNLKTVNVSSSATGSATPTSLITLAANFDADQTALLGAGRTVELNGNNNTSNTGSDIIIGNDVSGQDTNGIVRGDSFTITSVNPATTSTTQDVFTYGGFAIGRNINTQISGTNANPGGKPESTANGDGGLGDGGNLLDTETGVELTSTTGDSTITVNVANLGDYSTTAGANGNYASLSGITSAVATALGFTSADELNGEWQVTAKSAATGAGTITLQLATTSTSSAGANNTTATNIVSNRTNDFSGNIMDASSETDSFLSATDPTTDYTKQALDFSINVSGVGSTTLTYSSSPDATSGTFDSLSTLVDAINAATNSGLTASVVQGRLYISATDPSNQVTFSNGDATGNGATAPSGTQLNGINWIQELDLPAAGIPAPAAGVHVFNSLSSLANEINTVDPGNLTATVNNPNQIATLSINEANAQQTIDFTDGNSVTPTANVGGSLLAEFGFSTQGVGLTKTGTTTDGFSTYTTTTLPETYNPTAGSEFDMSSGSVTPQFSKDITIYDSLGKAHTIALNVAKLDSATGTWAVELTAVPASDVTSVNNDGLIAAGTIQFNGAGQITTVSSGLSGSIPIDWSSSVGANPSSIKLDLGLTTGSSNPGLTQAAGGFNVSVAQQNGSPTGELTGVSINQDGFVVASFSNGQTQEMFQIPLANFTNPDGLESISGDAYQETLASGDVNPELAGQSGVGTFTPSALEQSNVDLSTQLTNLIVAQQAYGANSKLLTVADTLLQELDQIIQ